MMMMMLIMRLMSKDKMLGDEATILLDDNDAYEVDEQGQNVG